MGIRILALTLVAAITLCAAPVMAAKKAKQPTEEQMISAIYTKGVEQVSHRQWTAGAESMTKVIENPKTSKDILANAYADRGVCYANKKLTDQAIADFNKALELKPDLQNALYERARALAMQGKHAEAVADLSKAIAGSQPSIITAGYYFNRGISYMSTSPPQPEKAKEDFAMAKKLNPKLKTPLKYRDL